MTGEIGIEWIKHDFDPPTCEVAKGHPHLLIVDGHTLHFTQELLEYAKDNNIHILCIPPHTTHALQSEFVLNLAAMQSNHLE